MKLKPRHRWFSNTDNDACDLWFGPHKTIEDAVGECIDQTLIDPTFPVYVCQGHKMTKAELGDMDVDDTWEVDTREAMEIKVIKRNV